jgi:hypothetical protein
MQQQFTVHAYNTLLTHSYSVLTSKFSDRMVTMIEFSGFSA